MKTKMVQYVDMFEPEKIIVARNKLNSSLQSVVKVECGMVMKSEDDSFVRFVNEKVKCKCFHANFVNGICQYRNCFHDEKHHH